MKKEVPEELLKSKILLFISKLKPLNNCIIANLIEYQNTYKVHGA